MKRLDDENKRQAEKRSDLKSDLEKHKNRAYTLESEVKSHIQNIAGLGKQKEAVKKRINENASKLRNLVGEVRTFLKGKNHRKFYSDPTLQKHSNILYRYCIFILIYFYCLDEKFIVDCARSRSKKEK